MFGSEGTFAKLGWGPMGCYQAASAGVSMIFTAVVYIFVCLKAWAGAFGVGAVTQYIAAITKASGGVSSIKDVEKLSAIGLYGAIIGKAYYTGAINLKEAIEVAE